MGQVNVSGTGSIIFQDDSAVEYHIGPKRLFFPIGIAAGTAAVGTAVFFLIALVFFDHIVIAVQHIQAVLPVKEGQKLKYVIMGFKNLLHTAVFPKFIPIAKLYIGIAAPVVLLQGGKI